MRHHHHAVRVVILVLIAAQSCSAFLSYTALHVHSNAPSSDVRRGHNINMQSAWKGFLDGVMGRTDAPKEGSSSGVLTPKSRVKLGDLSVSPMGELVWSLAGLAHLQRDCFLTVFCVAVSVATTKTCVKRMTWIKSRQNACLSLSPCLLVSLSPSLTDTVRPSQISRGLT